MVVGNEVVTSPVSKGQSTGDLLGVASATIQADDTSHEDFPCIIELYLLSRSVQIPRLTVAGDVMDGNSIGHNVAEVGKVEVASLFNTTLTSVKASPRVHCLVAEPPVS